MRKDSSLPYTIASILSGFFFFVAVTGSFAGEKGCPCTTPRHSASIIIVGPNDPVYTNWGHIGIALEDVEEGTDVFYDFGNFSFYSENFYTDFIFGRMLYLGVATPTEKFLNYYLRQNSNLTIYPLCMGDPELKRMQERLKWWVRPENKEYLYDYYHQNCSTIIRDVLDEALSGQIKKAAQEFTPYTFRHLTRTGTHEHCISEILLHYLLGPAQDYTISQWEWMFLPQAVIDFGQNFTYTGADGVPRTLVGNPRHFKTVDRPPVPETYRRLWPGMLTAGLLMALLWAFLRRMAFCSLAGCVTASSLLRGTISLLLGFAGAVLAFMMFFTDHTATCNNLNIGFTCPTVMAAVIPFFGFRKKFSSGRRKSEIIVSWIWTINMAGLLLSMALRLTGLSVQDSFAFWAFAGPLLWTASRPGLWMEEKIFGRITGQKQTSPGTFLSQRVLTGENPL